MANNCGSICPVEGGFLTYSPSVGGNACLLAAYAFLTPVTFYLGYRHRTPSFTAILAIGLLFEVLGFAGRILLHDGPDHQGYFALMLLGTVLGPTFMSGALCGVIPHVLAVYGETFSICRPIIAAVFLNTMLVISIILQVVGVVFVAYQYGGISRSRSADIITGGLGVQVLLLLSTAGLLICFKFGVGSGAEAPNPKHSDAYLSKRFTRFLRCMGAAIILLLGYSIYRMVEMIYGVQSGPFQDQPVFMVMNGGIPFIACLVLAVCHPGAAFGTSWAGTSPRRLWRHSVPPPIETPYGHAAHHRYDPTIRSQFSPSSQRPLRESKPPPTYGSYGLPPTPRPYSKPPSPMVSSPTSARTVSTRGLSERPPTNLVDSNALW